MKVLVIGTLPHHISNKNSGGVAELNYNLSKKLSDFDDVEIGILATNTYRKNIDDYKIKNGSISIYKSYPRTISGLEWLRKENSLKSFFNVLFEEFLKTLRPYFKKLPNTTSMLSYYDIKKTIGEFNPDIIHIYHASYLSILAKCISPETPVITHLISFIGMRNAKSKKIYEYKKLINETCLKKSDEVIVISEFIRNQAINKLAITKDLAEKFELVYCGIEKDITKLENKVDVINKYDLDPKDNILITVGKLHPWKGHIRMLKYVKNFLKNKNQKLVIIGDGPIKNKIQKTAEKLEIAERVLFTGRVEEDELKSWYKNADVFITTTKYEGFGIVIIEAMAFGIPVLAPNIQPINEFVEDGKTGMLFENKMDFQNKLRILLKDEATRKKISKNGQIFVDKNHTWESLAEKVKKIYNKVCVEIYSS